MLWKADINYVTILGQKLWHATFNIGKKMKSFDPTFKKIHYACGSVFMNDWLNVDCSLKIGHRYPYLCIDLVAAHPFPDNFFEYGFAEDFLEHLSQADSLIFLGEVYRTFKKGGVLRLSFPGLEGVLIKHYRPSDYGGTLAGKNEAYTRWGHLHFYSKEELLLVCKHIGFEKVEFQEYGKSQHKVLENLEHRSDQIGLNIYAEITK